MCSVQDFLFWESYHVNQWHLHQLFPTSWTFELMFVWALRSNKLSVYISAALKPSLPLLPCYLISSKLTLQAADCILAFSSCFFALLFVSCEYKLCGIMLLCSKVFFCTGGMTFNLFVNSVFELCTLFCWIFLYFIAALNMWTQNQTLLWCFGVVSLFSYL